MKKLLMFGLTVLISCNAYAGAGWALDKTILDLETNVNGTEIRLSGHGSGACEEITENGIAKTWTRIEADQANKEQLMSVLLTAFASGKKIDVYCAAGSWVKLGHIRIKP